MLGLPCCHHALYYCPSWRVESGTLHTQSTALQFFSLRMSGPVPKNSSVSSTCRDSQANLEPGHDHKVSSYLCLSQPRELITSKHPNLHSWSRHNYWHHFFYSPKDAVWTINYLLVLGAQRTPPLGILPDILPPLSLKRRGLY